MTMKVSAEENAASPKASSASSGRTVRSWPSIPPTRAFTATSRTNCPRFSLSPSRSAVASPPSSDLVGTCTSGVDSQGGGRGRARYFGAVVPPTGIGSMPSLWWSHDRVRATSTRTATRLCSMNSTRGLTSSV